MVVRFEPKPAPDRTAMVEDNGFLRFLDEASDPIGLIRRIRTQAGSTLATGAQLIGVDWGETRVDPDRSLNRLHWRCLNGVLALLDPIVTALTMAGTPREGPFAALINAELDELRGDDGAGIPQERDATAWLTDAVTGALVAPANEAGRARLVARLFGLHDQFDLALEAKPNGPGYELAQLPSLTAAVLAAHALGAAANGRFKVPDSNPSWSDDLDQQLDRELAAFAQQLETEQGTEDLILTLFDALALTDQSLAQHLGMQGGFQKSALGAFRAALAGSFNGAEAARQAYGQIVEHFLTLHLRGLLAPGTRWGRAELTDALAAADWFALRLRVRPPAGGALDAFAATLPIAGTTLSAADATALVDPDGWLSECYEDALAELTETGASKRRRVPDSVPQPLVVQVAVDHDISDADHFADRYQGVAVLLRREAEPWTYANLAVPTLKFRPEGAAELPIIVHPIRPATVDGQRKLAVDYHGIPLASTDFKASGSTAGEEALPFYTFTDPCGAELDSVGYRRLPALAYGTRYAIAAHVVSMSGALPATVADPAVPWRPAPQPSLPAEAPGVSHSRGTTYSRTTGIGQVELLEAVGGGAARAAFDAKIEGVQPLNRDYPRDGQVTARGGSASIDLWRARSGEGQIAPPQPNREVIAEIADIWGWGGSGRLVFELFQSAQVTPGDQPLASWPLRIARRFAGARLRLQLRPTTATLKMTGAADWPNPGTADVALTDEPLWLRARLEADPDIVLGISFTRVSAVSGGETSPNDQGFLLLAPNQTDWSGAPSETRATVRFPRMTFLDFDRWLSNPALALAAAEGALDELLKMHATLMDAFASEALDDSTAQGLSRLPDLAVRKLLIELVPLDAANEAPEEAVGSTAGDLSLVIDVPPIGRCAREAASGSNPDAGRYLKRIADTYKMNVVVRAGGPLGLLFDDQGTLNVSVPEGRVARLSVRALVDATLFTGDAPVIAPELAAWAVDNRTGHYVFDGAHLTVETMCDLAQADWPELAEQRVDIKPAGRDRRYDLVSHAADPLAPRPNDWAWRQIGAIRVDTQRWRFLGHPIHHWFDPKNCRFRPAREPEEAVWPALRVLSNHTKGFADIEAFEREAFLGRSDVDGDQHATLLRPEPSMTVLQSFEWEQPSATMFRHKVTLRSRYAGALRNRSAAIQVVHDELMRDGKLIRRPLGDWIRVAMLADASRLELTRPQLRALIPLTSSPDRPGAPPVMAFLAEHPFAHGGLADRIGAEVKTGFSFRTQNQRLTLEDSRKEFGPDPRLTYDATPPEAASAVSLAVEGPIGLTFDSESVAAPAFANTALVLSPTYLKDLASAAPPEEHFVSISMRRYLDHRWTVTTDAVPPPDKLPATSAWWIELEPAASAELKCGDTLLARIEQENGDWVARVGYQAVLPDSPPPLDPRPVVARVAQKQGRSIALLHQPLDEGRGALSIFLLQKRVDAEPERAPFMLASYEWSLRSSNPRADNEPRTKPIAEYLTVPPSATTHAVRASAATAMSWARTGVDATHLYVAKPGSAALEPASVEPMKLVRRDDRSMFVRADDGSPRWLRSKLSASPFPLHVHRHLAILLTGPAPGFGAPAEAFLHARLAPALALPIASKDAATRMRVVEFELPAHPMGSGLPDGDKPSAQRFSRAVFDLAATGAGRGSADAGLLIWVRPLGGFRTMRAGTSISMKVKWSSAGGQIPGGGAAFVEVGTGVAVELVQILLWLRKGQLIAAALDIEGVLRPLSGTLRRATAAGEAAELPPLAALETLTFEELRRSHNGTVDTGELWADISMITATQAPAARSADESPFAAVPLPLDRLFSDDGQPEAASIADAVGLEALRRQPEVEARIVAVTPPISLGGSG
ncbi:MAG: hypothetical protein M3N07_02215 [Pseudomonadota bacterium]|nr:hypothetical protein [Pseudomonadota bacterium]